MGNTLHKMGDVESALVSYNGAVKINPDFAEAHYRIGEVLNDQGDFDAAINSYKVAIKLKPDYAEAYIDMGNALNDQGNLEASIDSYKRAIKIKPDYAEAYYNMGLVLYSKGNLDSAIDSYKQALQIKPDNAEAYINMGNALNDQGKLDGAIDAYNKALSLNPESSEAYYNMGVALKGMIFQEPNPSIHKIIISILDRKTYVRPKDISFAVMSLLKLEPEIQNLLHEHSNGNHSKSLKEIISVLSNSSLLLKLMSVCPLADLEFEVILTDVRSDLLLLVSKSEVTEEDTDLLSFLSALALQCFTNEYVYNLSDTDAKAMKKLENLVENTFFAGKQPNPQSVLCLASFKALNEYEWCDLLIVTNKIEAVFRRLVIEPKEETYLRLNIQTLGKITDKVSSTVQEQYEANPYPRWVNLRLPLEAASISQFVDEINLRLFDNKINEIKAPSILIAGCGTGQHPIVTAARFKNSKVLAVDLSLSSLTYAIRKTRELSLRNIDYIQADILNLRSLGIQFNIIESVGVLHHMDDPFLGWEVLTDCLKLGGLMKIGLYSELARHNIVKMRKEITQLGNGSNDLEMKSFRSFLMESEMPHHQQILNSYDFYSLSELRDLLFHVQEHRFTIPQIKVYLNKLGLKFCGFESAKLVQDFKLNNIKDNDYYDLDNWQTYEELNPEAFTGMYQFWCQKAS